MLTRPVNLLLIALLIALLPLLGGAEEESAEGPSSSAEETPSSEEQPAPAIEALQAWARATRAQSSVGAAYVHLHNHSDQDDALVAVSSDSAGRIELHTHIKDGEMVRMVEVKEIALPAASATTLQPGGKHLMLFELSEPLVAGATFKLTFSFASGRSSSAEVLIGRAACASFQEALADQEEALSREVADEEKQGQPSEHAEHAEHAGHNMGKQAADASAAAPLPCCTPAEPAE